MTTIRFYLGLVAIALFFLAMWVISTFARVLASVDAAIRA